MLNAKILRVDELHVGGQGQVSFMLKEKGTDQLYVEGKMCGSIRLKSNVCMFHVLCCLWYFGEHIKHWRIVVD